METQTQSIDLGTLGPAIAASLASVTGKPWIFEPYKHYDESMARWDATRGYLTLAVGDETVPDPKIFIRAGGYGLIGRMEFSASWPMQPTRKGESSQLLVPYIYENGSRIDHAKATVSADRPAEKIAADLARRFLPAFDREWAEVCRQYRNLVGNLSAQDETIKALRALGATVNDRQNGYNQTTAHVEREGLALSFELHTDGSLYLRHGSVTLDALRAILATLPAQTEDESHA